MRLWFLTERRRPAGMPASGPKAWGRRSEIVHLRQRLLERREGDDGEHVGDRLDDEAGGDRGAVVMQDRDEPRRVDLALGGQQRAHLRVAVLLDDKDPLVASDEIEHLVMEREGPDA